MKVDVVELLLNEFTSRVLDDREKCLGVDREQLEKEFVFSLNKQQKQKYGKLCQSKEREELFHDRILIEYVLSFISCIFKTDRLK